MELCEAAKKGEEAAETTEELRCIDSLDHIKNSQIASQPLVSTQLVMHLLSLTRHPRKKIQDFASDLVVTWTYMFLEQIRDEKNGILGDIEPANIETAKVKNVDKKISEYDKISKISDVEIVKVQIVYLNDTSSSKKLNIVRSEIAMRKNTNLLHNVSFEKLTGEEGRTSGFVFQKFISFMIKCNNNFREIVRETLCDADEEIRDELKARDPLRFATSMDSAIFERLLSSQSTWEELIRASGDERPDHLPPAKALELAVGLLLKHLASLARAVEENVSYLQVQFTDASNRVEDLESKLAVAKDSQQEAERLKGEEEKELMKVQQKFFEEHIRSNMNTLAQQAQYLKAKVSSLEAEIGAAKDKRYRDYLKGINHCKIKILKRYPYLDLSFIDEFLVKATMWKGARMRLSTYCSSSGRGS